jgi:hypothetical protein
MGKLMVFLALVVLIAIVLGLLGYFLQSRSDAAKRGLTGSRKRIRALESGTARHVKALEEIREIATSSEIVSGDPLWSMVIDKVDLALEEENKK